MFNILSMFNIHLKVAVSGKAFVDE